MAGMDAWYHHDYPRTPHRWECPTMDIHCMSMARRQSIRDFHVRASKLDILKQRYTTCFHTHSRNHNMYCQEEYMRFQDALQACNQFGSNGVTSNRVPSSVLDQKPYEPAAPDDYQRVPADVRGYSHKPHPNTHREPIEMLQPDAEKYKPYVDPDRPSVSVRLFDNTRREVVLDLPPKKPATPKTVTSYDSSKFYKG